MIEYTVKVHDGGNKEWFLNGKRHREDGPAVESAYGHKEWHLNGKCHREDGPAIELSNGDKYWYLDDVQCTEEEYYSKLNPAKVKVDDIGTKAWEPNGKMHKDEGPAISC